MNTKPIIATFASLLAILLAACGSKDDSHVHDDHQSDHDEARADGGDQHFVKEPGPNGGRLISSIEPQAEFLLLPNRHAQLTFLDTEGKVLPIENQSAGIVTGDRMNPFIVELVINGNALVSESPLPDIEGQPLVLRIQTDPNADPVIERFNLKTYTCSGCKLAEYACICGH